MNRESASLTVELRGQSYAHDPETGERLSRITIFRELAEQLGIDPATPTTVTMTLSHCSSAFLIGIEGTQETESLTTEHRQDFERAYSETERVDRWQVTIDEELEDAD